MSVTHVGEALLDPPNRDLPAPRLPQRSHPMAQPAVPAVDQQAVPAVDQQAVPAVDQLKAANPNEVDVDASRRSSLSLLSRKF